MHVGIVGCGTAGPAAAIFLARAGHRVTILERAPTLKPLGAGLLIQPTGMLVLGRLGVLDSLLRLGDRIERLRGITTRGRPVLDLAYRDLRDDLFGLGVHRGALFTSLMRALHSLHIDTRCGVQAIAIESIGSRPLVRDARKVLHGPFDLLIVADGARSALRPASVQARVKAYPYGALWFVAEDLDQQFSGTLAQVYRGTRRMVGFLPSGRASADSPPLVSLFWSTRLDDADSIHDRGIDAWKADVRALTDQAEPILEQIDDTRQLILAAYHDVVLKRPYDFLHGPVVYLGDAAHAMSPQLGQGANLALVDAMTLADSLDSTPNLRAAIEQYARLRRASTSYYQFASRWLTPIFQSGLEPIAPARDLVMGAMCRIKWTRRQMLESLTGVKTGLMPWRVKTPPRIVFDSN